MATRRSNGGYVPDETVQTTVRIPVWLKLLIDQQSYSLNALIVRLLTEYFIGDSTLSGKDKHLLKAQAGHLQSEMEAMQATWEAMQEKVKHINEVTSQLMDDQELEVMKVEAGTKAEAVASAEREIVAHKQFSSAVTVLQDSYKQVLLNIDWKIMRQYPYLLVGEDRRNWGMTQADLREKACYDKLDMTELYRELVGRGFFAANSLSID
jgi:hypothetical protein